MKTIRLSENPKILVTRTDRIGDLVLTTPVFKVLREKFPQAWIAALVFQEHREIVKGNPYLDEIILYDKKGREKSGWGQIKFAGFLRRKKFDAVIHCHGTNRMHLAAWLAGIPFRIGYARRAPWALTHVHPYNKKEGKKQEAEYLFDLLAPLGISQPAKIETFFPVTDRAKRSLENLIIFHKIKRDLPHSLSKELKVNGTGPGNLLRKENKSQYGGQGLPWIVLSPSASDATKMWPAERFAELASDLYAKHPCVFIAIGKREDREIIARLKQHSRVPVYDLSGRLTLGMLGALLRKAILLVSNDSGPVHIAVAVRTPVVSIFGRYEPGLGPDRWKPLGDQVRVVAKDVSHVPEDQRKFTYIDEIELKDVFRAAMELLPPAAWKRDHAGGFGGGEECACGR